MAKSIGSELMRGSAQREEYEQVVEKIVLQRKVAKFNLQKGCRLMLEKLFKLFELNPEREPRRLVLEQRIYQYMLDIEKVPIDKEKITEEIVTEILFAANSIEFNVEEFLSIKQEWELLTGSL